MSGSVQAVSQTFGQMSIQPRRCFLAHIVLNDDQAAAAAALHPGDAFSADCTIGHYIMGARFEDCRLVGGP